MQFDGMWRGDGLIFEQHALDVQLDRLDNLVQRIVHGIAGAEAAWKIRHRHTIATIGVFVDYNRISNRLPRRPVPAGQTEYAAQRAKWDVPLGTLSHLSCRFAQDLRVLLLAQRAHYRIDELIFSQAHLPGHLANVIRA